MVPLVMTNTKEENPASSIEEFATHLSLYDDTFHFLEKLPPPPALVVSSTREDIKGPLPPSVFCPTSKKPDEAAGQVKVKRKCGRPRNPIPRHKRESHINAEHRRRGKIQDGFRTLKNIVPKYEQTSGRDSKADILFKAVDHCKLLQRDINELKSSIQSLTLEKEALSAEVNNYSAMVPEASLQEKGPPTLDDRYTKYVHQKCKESRTFGTFKGIMRPLWDSYKMNVRDMSMEEFLRSVSDWAAGALSFPSLRSICHSILRDGPTGSYSTSSGQKETALAEMTHYGSDGLMASSLLGVDSSSNNNNNGHTSYPHHNNHCLNSLAFSADHQLGSRDGASSACSSVGGAGISGAVGGGDTGSGAVAEHAYAPSHLEQLSRAVPHSPMPHGHDLGPYRANGMHSNINSSNFESELYLGLDHDLHHQHHMALPSALGPWQHHRIQPHHHHHIYHNDHYAHLNNFHDVRKPHSYWSTSHHGELNPRHTTYHPHLHHNTTFNDLDFKSEMPSRAQEPTASLAGHRQRSDLGYPSHYSQHHSHRRLSRSSSESEGSVLNMGNFVKQATETLADPDKFGQLSPSTDSCVSPGSSVYLGSPGALASRTGDHTFSYRTHGLDNYMQHRSVLQERMDNSSGHNWTAPRLSMSLPSYRETFGPRTVDYHRHSITGYEDEVRPHWGVEGWDNILSKGSGHPQAHGERLESSSLLAELLSQRQPSMPPPSKPVRLLSDHSITSNAATSEAAFIAPDTSFHGEMASTNTSNDQSVTGLSASTKQGDIRWTWRCPEQSSKVRADHISSRSSFSSSEDKEDQPKSTARDTASLDKDADLKPRPSSDTWINFGQLNTVPNPQRTGQPENEYESQHSSQSKICHFELAHQQMLKNQSLSGQMKPKISGLVSKTSRSSSDPLATAQTMSKFSNGQAASPPCFSAGSAPSLSHRQDDDKILVQRAGRKSSFEGSFPADHSALTEMSGCKKFCHWPPISETRDKYELSETASDKLPNFLKTECGNKSLLGAGLGESAIRF